MGPRADDDVDRIDTDEVTDEITEETATIEITRAQIDQTRNEMSETIDAIRARLEPQTLAEQAKETVADITTQAKEKAADLAADVMDKAKETVHDVVQEAKETLPTLTSNAAQSAVSGAVDTARDAVGSAVDTARHAVGDAAHTARDAGATLMDAIRRNPIPAALIAAGIGWLWANSRNRDGHAYRGTSWSRRTGTPYDEGSWGREAAASAGAEHWAVSGQEGRPPSPVTGDGDHTHGVGAAVGEVRERVSQATGQVREKFGDMAGQVQEKVSVLGSRVGEQTRHAAGSLQRMLEERPLAVGAMALGLGAAIGLLVPGTYREDQLLGEARDQFMDKAKHTAEDLATRAQIVAEEAMETAAEEARHQGLAE